MRQPPHHFDVPTSQFTDVPAFVPLKAHDPLEVERRQNLLPGELILEMQRDGLSVARTVLDALTDEESLRFILPIISMSTLNSVWHQFSEPTRLDYSGVRRPRIELPRLKELSDAHGALIGMKSGLAKAEPLSRALVNLHGTESTQQRKAIRAFADTAGPAALTGTCIAALMDEPMPGTELRAQLLAREQSFQLAESRHRTAKQFGTILSLAQLAEIDSDESVAIRRNAPRQARKVFTEVQHDMLPAS